MIACMIDRLIVACQSTVIRLVANKLRLVPRLYQTCDIFSLQILYTEYIQCIGHQISSENVIMQNFTI